ncbi:antitoxin Xre/MbcA/ParS toxin-binding domain-containing protein [Agromyces silvae]|uniref:antitoxin Xre/MbcA/ParS toxin-binding domain-containing protein n=1 Tax=Agromyces silvae TaxID=3388266 RepID=UPI00280ADB57|nr:antitoxin Xre/MbcA/ParS toxin-binding domain-containing protein [Agromyces protaetiae]
MNRTTDEGDPHVMDVPVGEVRVATARSIGAQGLPGPADFVALPDEAGALVVEFVARLQTRLTEDGADALDGVDIGGLADRMIALVPMRQLSEWDRLVGPFYDTTALSAWKHLSRQRLSVLRQAGRLLGLRTSDGAIVHPSFQFDDRGGLLPHLAEVQAILAPEMDDAWTRALWLNTPLDLWGGRTAAQMLRSTAEDVTAVLEMAQHDTAIRSR